MCTVSWLHEDGGYQLLCNRDELFTRREAEPPRAVTISGVRVIAPRDGEAGGSWISVNEYGVALCLLNGTGRAVDSPSRSRGSLLMNAAGSSNAHDACDQVYRHDLRDVAPFTLLALEPGMRPAVVEWNGEESRLSLDASSLMPLTSSSVNAPRVRARRLELLGRHGRDLAALRAFHRCHDGHPSADSPCMHRPDAATVSFSHVTVDRDSIQFQYSAGPPCQARGPQITRMRRARQAVSTCCSNSF